MEEAVHSYFAIGLALFAHCTYCTYYCDKNHHSKFCQESELVAILVQESALCLFVLYLATQGLKHDTIKVFLSAVSHLQMEAIASGPHCQSFSMLSRALGEWNERKLLMVEYGCP